MDIGGIHTLVFFKNTHCVSVWLCRLSPCVNEGGQVYMYLLMEGFLFLSEWLLFQVDRLLTEGSLSLSLSLPLFFSNLCGVLLCMCV